MEVHCARVERPTILRLAVKYQLHPLPVALAAPGNQRSKDVSAAEPDFLRIFKGSLCFFFLNQT